MPFALDTSCIVPLLCPWEDNHLSARQAVEFFLSSEPPLILPAPALAETYSVLTRMQPPHRTKPSVVLQTLIQSFQEDSITVSLQSEEYWDEIQKVSTQGLVSGAIHDAIIARCARKGGATKILTFNYRHFMRFTGPDLEIIVPGSDVNS